MLCPEKKIVLCAPAWQPSAKKTGRSFLLFTMRPSVLSGPPRGFSPGSRHGSGLKGANQTGRPFTNDYAGDLLYPVLKKYGLAAGCYGKRADDGFELTGARVTNAVRCVPPQNKVVAEEVNNCRRF